MNPKTVAREYALQFLFHLDSSQFEELKDKETLKRRLTEFDTSYYEPDQEQPNRALAPDIKNFALQLIEGVIDNYRKLFDKVESSLINKKIQSIEHIDLTILLMSIFELDNSPKKVVINEAINLAKKYSTKNSFPFINGFLDKL